MKTWHDLRKDPLDLPQIKTTSTGERYTPLVLCFEWRKDDRGKKAKVYALDRYNPYPFNEWEDNKHGYDAWRELPAPPKEPKKTIASAICDNACQVCPYGKNCDLEVEE